MCSIHTVGQFIDLIEWLKSYIELHDENKRKSSAKIMMIMTMRVLRIKLGFRVTEYYYEMHKPSA